MQGLTQRYRYSIILLRELVRTDFKLRYQGSVLGYLWSLLRPLFLFSILYVIFVHFAKTITVPHPGVYLLLGVVLWNYFVEVTSGSVGAIVGRGDLMRKINFPKYVIILAGSMSALINLLLNFIVIGFFMAINHVSLSVHTLLVVPIVIELFVFSLGIAFSLSALFVKFRDISYIWEIVVQGGFYVTPILYMLTILPPKVGKVLLLNPVAQIIQDARYAIDSTQTETIGRLYGGRAWVWLIPLGIGCITTVIGATYFRKQSKNFAEEI